jgi:hypothetical protein
LLHKWEERVETVNVITVHDDLVDGEEEILDSIDVAREKKSFNVGGHLSEEENKQLFSLFENFKDVFTDKLGCTDLIQHVIRLTDSKPCVQAPYKVPEALRDEVQKKSNGYWPRA